METMSYLVTTATAVATAVTTTALVLPLLSCSPSSAYQKLLQWKGSSEKTLSCTTSVVILKMELSAGCQEDSAAEADTSMKKDNEVFMDPSWMADLFVAFLKSAPLCNVLPDCKRHSAFVALQHAMAQDTIQEHKRYIHERTSVDVALSEDEAEKLFRYFNFAVWSMENSFSTVLSPSKHAKDGRMSLQDQLKGTGYKTIQCVRTNEPHVASHVLAVHYGKKEVVLSISFGHLAREEDSVVRSLVSGVEPRTKLLSIRKDHGFPIYAREDLLQAAENLSDDTFHLVEHLFIPNGFRVILCGHSLGAGVAGLLGVLWKDFCRTRDLILDLQVYAFGPPPCLSQSFCIETESYLTTVISNNDCLPRLSTNSLSSLETHLALVNTRLKMCSLSPRDMLTAKRNLSDILKLSKKAVLSPQDIMLHSGGLAGDEGQLAVPGKILCVWNHIEDANILSVSCPHVDSPLIKDFFLDSSMVYDHTVDAYRANLELLAEQTANTI